MKKLLLVLLSALFAASFCTAQSMTPTAHQLGVGASVSSSNTTVQLFYDVTNSFMIEPQVGFAHSNNASSSGGGTATNYPDTWWNVGLGVYYVAMRMQRLAVLIGPAAQYSSEQFTASPASSYTLGDVVKHTYWNAEINLQLLGMITQNLGVYSTLGGYYFSNDFKDTTANTDSLNTGYGIQSLSLGVSYYFK